MTYEADYQGFQCQKPSLLLQYYASTNQTCESNFVFTSNIVMKKKCLTKIRLSLFKSIHLLERRGESSMAHMWGWENYFHELGLSNHSRDLRIHPHWLRISIIRNRNGEEDVFVHLSHLLLHNDCKSPWIKSILMIILNKNLLYCYTVTLNYELKINDKFRKLPPQQPSRTQKGRKIFFVCSWGTI